MDGSFGEAELVMAANSPTIDAWAVGSEDGKTLYFGSNRTGGSFWKMSRPTAGGTFGAASVVTELETANDEAPEWLSADTCVILFHRDGTGGLGGYDTWIAKKPQ